MGKRKLQIKGKSLTRVGYVNLEDIVLPIKTCGIKRTTLKRSEIMDGYKVPTKKRRMTEEEKEEHKKLGYNVDKLIPWVLEYDYTDETMVNMQDDLQMMTQFYALAGNVDLAYKNDGERKELWEILGLESKDDVYGCAKWLSELGMDNLDIQIMQTAIFIIKKSKYTKYEDVPEDADTMAEAEKEIEEAIKEDEENATEE